MPVLWLVNELQVPKISPLFTLASRLRSAAQHRQWDAAFSVRCLLHDMVQAAGGLKSADRPVSNTEYFHPFESGWCGTVHGLGSKLIGSFRA
jgi:hypothetical protein